jgi:hypothetical protein
MRFMVIVKGTRSSEAGVLPSEELLTATGKYSEELTKAGVMLAGEGLHPSSKGARVRFEGEKRTAIDGSFAATKELVARLLALEVRVAAGGNRMGQALSQSHARGIRDRDSAGVRGRGLWPRPPQPRGKTPCRA